MVKVRQSINKMMFEKTDNDDYLVSEKTFWIILFLSSLSCIVSLKSINCFELITTGTNASIRLMSLLLFILSCIIFSINLSLILTAFEQSFSMNGEKLKKIVKAFFLTLIIFIFSFYIFLFLIFKSLGLGIGLGISDLNLTDFIGILGVSITLVFVVVTAASVTISRQALEKSDETLLEMKAEVSLQNDSLGLLKKQIHYQQLEIKEKNIRLEIEFLTKKLECFFLPVSDFLELNTDLISNDNFEEIELPENHFRLVTNAVLKYGYLAQDHIVELIKQSSDIIKRYYFIKFSYKGILTSDQNEKKEFTNSLLQTIPWLSNEIKNDLIFSGSLEDTQTWSIHKLQSIRVEVIKEINDLHELIILKNNELQDIFESN